MEAVKQSLLRFLKRHRVLVAFVVLSSAIAAVVYELTNGGMPRAMVYDAPALSALDLRGHRPRAIWRDDEFECLGWRATHDCDPFGARDRSRDRKCDEPMPRVSGYCEVRNATSGEVFHVMLATCKSWRWWLVKTLTCNDARYFTDFSLRAAEYQHPPAIHPPSLPRKKTLSVTKDSANGNKALAAALATEELAPVSFARGVVLIAFPKAIAGVYAVIRLLRHLGCALPVEVWIDPLEMHAKHSILLELVKHHGVFLRTIEDPSATKFHAKPYTIYHSRFESVLFLDSDNLPARDPTYLFGTPEFQKFGAIFWPDFWRPSLDTVFNVQEQSALWQLLDMPFIDMFEQESGQVLINKTASANAMHKLMFYSANVPRLLTDWELVYGDKDLFRLAWLNTSTPFHFVQHVLALAGLYDKDEDFFCGVAMVQRDPQGDIVFMHRNQEKLSGRRDQKVLMTHFQKFTGGDGDASSLKRDLDKYRIQCKVRRLGQYVCFRINPVTANGENTPLLIQSLEGTRYPQVEKQAIHFSIEGRSLLTKHEEAEIAAMEDKMLAKQAAEEEAAVVGRKQADQTWYSLVLCASILTLGVLWRWNAHRKRQQRAAAASPGRPTSGSAELELAISGVNDQVAVRRKKSSSVGQYGDQHVL
ncbi:hypothetical protein Gpo141_00009124 [Globisporangium polare]